MTDIPIHKAVKHSDSGIFAKEVSYLLTDKTVDYAHRDDYYVFGMVESGQCRVAIDSGDYNLSAGDIICIQPGQIHNVLDAGDAKALLLFIDGVFIDMPAKRTLSEYALAPCPFKISDVQRSELTQLFSMILHRIDECKTGGSRSVLQNLSCALAGIITDAVREFTCQKAKNKRHVEITLAFRELLSKEKQINRNVSYYAQSLHISSVYLNEVIKNVTGVSVSKYIRNEIILRAKRMLIYTTLTVREVSERSGIDDYSYFTRLFTKSVGVTPTFYRRKYLG